MAPPGRHGWRGVHLSGRAKKDSKCRGFLFPSHPETLRTPALGSSTKSHGAILNIAFSSDHAMTPRVRRARRSPVAGAALRGTVAPRRGETAYVSATAPTLCHKSATFL